MIKHKMITQINALLHTTVFIWEVIFVSAQQIYSIIIRSVLFFESAVWHLLSFSEQKNTVSHTVKNMTVKLADIQNRCLQVISEVYKIMSITALKTETYISSLNLHLNVKLAKFHQCHKQSEMKELVVKSCRWIQNKLQLQHNRLKSTVSKHQIQWAEHWLKSEKKMKMSAKQALLHR